MKNYVSYTVAGLALFAGDLHAGGMAGYGIPEGTDVYAGISAGLAKQSGACRATNYDTDCKDTPAGYKAYAGARLGSFTQQNIRIRDGSKSSYGLETGYIDFGKSKAKGRTSNLGAATQTTSKVKGGYVAAVGYVPMVDNAELIGKAGAGYWEQEGEFTRSDQNVKYKTKKRNAGTLIGAGIQVKVNKSVAIRAEYEQAFGTGNKTAYEAEAGLYSVGALFNF